MKILFLDNCTPKPYDCITLANEPMGGTEATVVRVAEGLASRGHEVTVWQHCREEVGCEETSVHYAFSAKSYPTLPPGRFDVVVVIRDLSFVKVAKRVYPDAHHVLWCHDLSGAEWGVFQKEIEEAQPTIVAVSDFHKTDIQQHLSAFSYLRPPVVKRIYNPVVVEKVEDLAVSPRRLCFMSSPHKGLKGTLALFEMAKYVVPDLQLYLGNPGYVDLRPVTQPGVTTLGSLPHKQACRVMQSSAVLFYPNTVFPETFGLVLAEANALGTPVLCNGFGAAFEVLGQHNPQVVDCREPKRVVDGLQKLLEYRPSVGPDPRFHLDRVLTEWEGLF